MKTWEMMKELTNNPNRRARLIGSNYIVHIGLDGTLREEDNGRAIFTIIDEWILVEPSYKTVNFNRAFKALMNGNKIKSIVTGNIYESRGKKMNDSEIDGDWIIL